MISPLRFVGRFLVAFALFISLGTAVDLPSRYGSTLERAAAVVLPLTGGWWMESRESPRGRELWLRRGSQEMRLQFDLGKLSLGLYPLLSLITATPGLGWRRWARAVALGAAGFFLLDLSIVALYPVLVRPGALTDIVGTFLGLLAFVGGPVILWFALTFDRLRDVWRLPLPERPE
jgi:hypothetical protein